MIKHLQSRDRTQSISQSSTLLTSKFVAKSKNRSQSRALIIISRTHFDSSRRRQSLQGRLGAAFSAFLSFI